MAVSILEDMRNRAKKEDSLLDYLAVKLAPVLTGLKPASLLALCRFYGAGEKSFYDLWTEKKEDIAGVLGVSFRELKETLQGRQVLFYCPERLCEVVAQPENDNFLAKFGYSSCRSLEEYLELLKARFNGRPFPHEIGVFLGYPLKDVKGFIYKGSMPVTAKGRWQVFGEASGSLRLMRMHEKAEMIFMNLIRNGRDPMIFQERISLHFRRFFRGIAAT
ncbi:MAG: DUF3793 family protein [Candidatus Omnitrophota bacterium]|nr:DUF3793 family protein [Candidatus Omnitrophota bacterium]